MKRILVWGVMVAAVLMLSIGACLAESTEAEWTVLFYLCGSDLESKYSYATYNLQEMQELAYPFDLRILFYQDEYTLDDITRDIGKVNVLIETGGSEEWHTQDLNMPIDPGKLQRWYLDYFPYENEEGRVSVPEQKYQLMETLPLQDMALPETLADFIRWGAENYPAKKTALVLWGHGGGAKSGLCIDELYDGDIMHLYELRQALEDGGLQLEAVIIDACLMANIETAWTVKDYAKWMVASEEEVPGKGSAIGLWLQALVNNPGMTGEWLGRCIVDGTSTKYANEEDERSRSLLTWSVIDLSKTDKLVESYENLYKVMGEALRDKPDLASLYTRYIYETEEYGDGQGNMRDLGSLLFQEDIINYFDSDILNDAVQALSEAVAFISRGSGRMDAHGLSFCYPADFDNEEMDLYARNYPMPYMLAYLDAISPWNAPESVYTVAEKLPDIDSIKSLQIQVEKRIDKSGIPSISFGNTISNLEEICYSLYRLDEETGCFVRLGRTDCGHERLEDHTMVWRPRDLFHWPSIDGTICCIDMIQYTEDMRLYNVPVRINSDVSILRCGQTLKPDADGILYDYNIYGIWEGYDENSELLNRSVVALAMLSGRQINMLYPVEGTSGKGKTSYTASQNMTLYRQMDVVEIPLPPGTYYMEYDVCDIFMRRSKLDRIEFQWDGENMIFADDLSWEGKIQPDWGWKLPH